MPDMPEKVKQFAVVHVRSVENLRILFALRLEAARDWSVQSMCHHLTLDTPSVEKGVKELAAEGLVNVRLCEDGLLYRYNSPTGEMAQTVDEFMHWFRIAPLEVIAAVKLRSKAVAPKQSS